MKKIIFPLIVLFLFSILTALLVEKIIFTDSSNNANTFCENIALTQHYWNTNTSPEKSITTNNEIDSTGWYSQAIENIKRSEYNITWQNDCNAYQSPNRAQNMRFIYANDGFTVKPRTTKIPLFDPSDRTLKEEEKKYREIEDWEVTMNIIGYGRTAQQNSFTGNALTVSENTAFIEDEGLKIEYKNNEEGMRQNFIIKEKPEGNGLLKLEIATRTELKLRVGANAVAFSNTGSEEKLKYSGLKVWDSENKLLTAHFEKETNNRFAIVVKEDNAVYPVTIDPLSSTPNWTAEGFYTNDYFGASVSTAGDVNGDGYSDVIIGATGYDNGQYNEGRAFVYHGSAAGLLSTPSWTAESDQEGAWFGYVVATAGDVNGDGYSDVIISSPLYNSGENYNGAVFGYYGSSNGLSVEENWIVHSNASEVGYGHSISTAGDVNGDGYSDVLVGGLHSLDWGFARIYYGHSSGLWSSGSLIIDQIADPTFGELVSTAGDINGDGYNDIIIGCPNYSISYHEQGRVYVYYGSSSGLEGGEWIQVGNWGAGFGKSVSTAGDVNGDGYCDIMIGIPYNDWDVGAVNVYFGTSEGLSTVANLTLEGDQDSSYFGCCISTAGDVNGDGYSDVIIGAFRYDNGQSDEGRAFAYYGSASGLSTTANWTAESNQVEAYFGCSVSTAGDVNGDGYSDVIVGAYHYDNLQSDEGRALVYHGSANGLSTLTQWVAESDQLDAHFGWSVSTAGDVNGDGYSDVIIGADDYDNGQSDEGRAFEYHGSSSGLSAIANWTAESDQVGAHFGNSVATAGDVNGDGYGDVIIGAPNYDNGQTDEGRAFAYYGSISGLSGTANWIKECNQINANFGVSVSTAGDVNGDGYSDVIVGADHVTAVQTEEGRAFVYHGSAIGLSSSVQWSKGGNQENASYGRSVSTAGDVNGDGYSDVIIGSPTYDDGQTDEGKVFVYHGSSSGLSSSVQWSIGGNQANAIFGCSVSSAGDVNGDGYSDVIIGADNYDNGQSNEGRAFVYHGSSSGLLTPANWIVEINEDFANFGYSVSTAGDVNGDGYCDVIVGAYHSSIGQTNAGMAFVYHGSAVGLSATSNWWATSYQTGAYFGYNVSSAGDVNGDGYSDIIVGAPYYANGQTNEGRAYVYYGNDGTGLRNTLQQYQAGTSVIVGPDGNVGTGGQIKFNGFAKSPFGRADGKLVYEYVPNGTPFGSTVNFTGSQSSYTDLGTTITGVELNEDVSGIPSLKNYRWRERIKYSPVNNPYQVYSPWRYYTSYQSKSFGSFKTFAGSATTTFQLTVSIANGWNMVSVPGLHPTDQNVNTWWQYRDMGANVFKYAGGYLPVTTATPGLGYWMKHAGDRTYNTGEEWPAGGIQIVPHDPLNVASGWNLIGGYEDIISTANLTTTPPNQIAGPVYKYSGGYFVATTLDPGYGYWIKLLSACQINIPDALAKGSGEIVEWFKDDWGRIILTDNAGRSFTLYAVKGKVDLSQYELPPFPPVGMFDIRFGSGRIAEDLNSAIQTIEMNGIEYPVIVKVENMSITLQDESGKEINAELKSGEQIKIDKNTVSKLLIISSEIVLPIKYALEQNYPNPFNPITTIKFSIPEATDVTLTIYNVLGEKVTELVNSKLEAGRYNYEWNAGNVATGMYIYELRTDKFVSVKKMVLMK